MRTNVEMNQLLSGRASKSEEHFKNFHIPRFSMKVEETSEIFVVYYLCSVYRYHLWKRLFCASTPRREANTLRIVQIGQDPAEIEPNSCVGRPAVLWACWAWMLGASTGDCRVRMLLMVEHLTLYWCDRCDRDRDTHLGTIAMRVVYNLLFVSTTVCGLLIIAHHRLLRVTVNSFQFGPTAVSVRTSLSFTPSIECWRLTRRRKKPRRVVNATIFLYLHGQGPNP